MRFTAVSHSFSSLFLVYDRLSIKFVISHSEEFLQTQDILLFFRHGSLLYKKKKKKKKKLCGKSKREKI